MDKPNEKKSKTQKSIPELHKVGKKKINVTESDAKRYQTSPSYKA